MSISCYTLAWCYNSDDKNEPNCYNCYTPHHVHVINLYTKCTPVQKMYSSCAAVITVILLHRCCIIIAQQSDRASSTDNNRHTDTKCRQKVSTSPIWPVVPAVYYRCKNMIISSKLLLRIDLKYYTKNIIQTGTSRAISLSRGRRRCETLRSVSRIAALIFGNLKPYTPDRSTAYRVRTCETVFKLHAITACDSTEYNQ